VSSLSGTAGDRHGHTSPSLIADKLSADTLAAGYRLSYPAIGLSGRGIGLGVAGVMSAPTTADARLPAVVGGVAEDLRSGRVWDRDPNFKIRILGCLGVFMKCLQKSGNIFESFFGKV